MFVKKEDISPDALIFDPDSGLLGFVCVTDLREGMVVGEKGLYDGTPRSATVLCVSQRALRLNFEACGARGPPPGEGRGPPFGRQRR